MITPWLEQYLPNPIDWKKINRVLVVKLRHHGDVLLSSPVFQALKNHHPHLQIDALVYQDTAPMLKEHPAIEQLFCIDKKWKKLGPIKSVVKEYSLLKQLKKQQYDVVINLTESRRGAWIKMFTGAKFGIAGNYKNRQDKSWKKAFPLRYPLPRFGNTRHTVEVHLDALRKAGIQVQQQDKPLVLKLDQQDYEKCYQLLESTTATDGKYIVMHPTSRWLFKTWRLDKYRELIERLLEKGETVVISAAPDEVEMSLVNHILDGLEHSNLVRLEGKLSLRSLAALVDKAKLMIGVDSVPMHIAAAMNTPSVSLFGPSGNIEWAPWNDNATVITSQTHTCRPCGYDGCGSGKISECLATIDVDTVYKAIQQQLEKA
ncbi:putative lipopolysaccharide heptosyltransferase III [Vibrio intestinalis]|uniref:putative lipopolysaccharide heptosyltransferase III n=1 Tax=Vibrio intestinalis TaxID=2933291 RepID=UPI0021A7D201|nr:putative lipopolysaccharide heptosyltransferase III [Vibrio intestinalis]